MTCNLSKGSFSDASRARRISDDCAMLDRLGLTREIVARRLRMFRAAAETGIGRPVGVPPHFEAVMDDARGRLPCPFGDARAFAKLNTTIRNLATGESAVVSDLALHMIEEHGWFGDPASPFRLGPELLARIMELP